MGNNNKAPMMQPIPLAQPQGPQPPQNAQTMPGQTFGQPTGGVPGYPDSTCKCNGWFRVGLF